MSELDAIRNYDGRANNWRLDKDPRCLWGWGPPTNGCTHMFGHACFRPLGHPGECWDSGGPLDPVEHRLPCDTARRPNDWDARGRREANQ